MARFVWGKIDRFINYLTVFVLVSGGLLLHILTALTIKSYYGLVWGYTAFLLPGFSELFLVIFQITEHMYNYMIILAAFASVSALLGLTCLIKNILKTRMAGATENRMYRQPYAATHNTSRT